MAIPEILIVLSSISVNDTLPQPPITIPVVKQPVTVIDSLPGKKDLPAVPARIKNEKKGDTVSICFTNTNF